MDLVAEEAKATDTIIMRSANEPRSGHAVRCG
ncbi:hypothetical protein M2427_007528 [Bradyrhizobium sp. BR13661]|nr:hypothetical protein [Bradyrhizobium sp. BR13661]